jgi:hypothetical protein
MQTNQIDDNPKEILTDEERINVLLRKITNLNALEESHEKNYINSVLQEIQ